MSSRGIDGPLLLDTHVWIWLMEAVRGRLGPATRALVERGAGRNALRVSTMSAWEVAMLESRGRVTLTLDCRAWMRRALDAPGLQLQALTPDIAIESTRLPGDPGHDPVDRILIATARLTGSTLVTRDERLLDYAATGRLRAVAAGD
ncbi:MAG: type II toxin-antitoxin system VapC family toxin [Acidobacteria bacterium]|nr:type II toxin-antitoxin system VapC family toxin [Acidobacteriota bacterium]